MSSHKIPFQIDAQRVISLFAKQIYQSPLALLRENAQNAHDAVLMRRHQGDDFDARIDIQLEPHRIVVRDNGIGMNEDEVRNNFWRAGSSGKNTPEAAAAGVVGTFGIGAMANFGVARRLTMETEEVNAASRITTEVALESLSLQEDCIDFRTNTPHGTPGTTVVALMKPSFKVDVSEAERYVTEFVGLSEVPVFINGKSVSGKQISDFVPRPQKAWEIERQQVQLGSALSADVQLIVSQNADAWIYLRNLNWASSHLPGEVVLRSGQAAIKTFRSRFGLATITVSSSYQLGGVVNIRTLQPTAGREALTTESLKFMQTVVLHIEEFISLALAQRPECDSSTQFMSWVLAHRRFDLCGNLKMNMPPTGRIRLDDVRTMAEKMSYYGASDQSVVRRFASEENPLLVLAHTNPRRRCEMKYLERYCRVEEVSDTPVVERKRDVGELTMAERALSFRLEAVLDSDYFVKARVTFADISHGLSVFAEQANGEELTIFLDARGQTLGLVLNLYEREYGAFGSMVKDFARSVVFPRISDHVPSSTRQGAEAFLRAVRKPREVFEIEDTDKDSLAKVWKEYTDGTIDFEQMISRSYVAVQSGVQVVDSGSALDINGVVPDVLRNEQEIRSSFGEDENTTLDPRPSITRTEIHSSAKMLTLSDDEVALRGYRCFLALTPKVREEIGDFFLQAHRTSIVWGGQRVLYVFLDHSGTYGVYYDLQTSEMLAAESGGGPVATCTIMLRDTIYIPVPGELNTSFVPREGERKRFEVRQDILRISDL